MGYSLLSPKLKVWHDGLIFKLHQNGICSEMINILEDLLSNRKSRVVLNGPCTSSADIRCTTGTHFWTFILNINQRFTE